ncbi:hypothetical protein [Methylomonas koyamae]|uniref:hypothetical protein n=1 Tax=Methylomonas koyamae TaxID=702114 RepID=UPI002872F047|nr:hypothetical protein [Methylomonas koyamae]WNB77335.1 hypothetical protein RI210_07095 [Methylomonas koyamae]
MTKGSFVFPKDNISMSSAAYGYWSVRWPSFAWPEVRGHSDFSDIQVLENCSYLQSLITYLQNHAVITASYWIYAVYLLGLPEEQIDELTKGMMTSVDELQFEGKPLDPEAVELFIEFFNKYYRAIYDDIWGGKKTEPGVLQFDCGCLSRLFIKDIEEYNFSSNESIGVIESLYIQQLVAAKPLALFDSLKEQQVYFDSQLVSEI